MPTIPEFSVTQGRQAASAVKVTPSEEAIQTLQQGARNISRLTNEQAQYTRQAGQDIGRGLGQLGAGAVDFGKAFEQHQALQEIFSMGPSFANMMNSLVNQMHAAIQSNDPEAIQKFQDSVQTQLDEWQAKAISPGARAHAITQVDQLRNHILGTWLPGEMATSAYHKAVTDLGTMSNTYASLAANKPETLDSIIPMMGTQIDTLVANHTLTPGSAEELKGLKQREIGKVIMTAATSVLRGNPAAGIASNPNEVRQWPKRYGSWLTPEQQQHIISEADAQDRVIKVQSRADEAEQTRIEKKAYSDKMSDIITGMIQPDGSLRLGPTTVHDIVAAGSMPGRTPGETEAMAKMTQSLIDRHKSGKDVISDPTTLATLQGKAISGNLTPQELYENASKLSEKDVANTYTMMERLNKSTSDDGKIAQSYQNAVKQTIAPTNAMNLVGNGAQLQQYARWMGDAVPQVRQMMSQGKTASEAWAAVSTPEFLQRYKVTGASNLEGVQGLTLPPATKPPEESKGILDRIFSGFGSK